MYEARVFVELPRGVSSFLGHRLAMRRYGWFHPSSPPRCANGVRPARPPEAHPELYGRRIQEPPNFGRDDELRTTGHGYHEHAHRCDVVPEGYASCSWGQEPCAVGEDPGRVGRP